MLLPMFLPWSVASAVISVCSWLVTFRGCAIYDRHSHEHGFHAFLRSICALHKSASVFTQHWPAITLPISHCFALPLPASCCSISETDGKYANGTFFAIAAKLPRLPGVAYYKAGHDAYQSTIGSDTKTRTRAL